MKALLLLALAATTCLAQERQGDELPKWTPLTRAIRLEKFDEAKSLIDATTARQPDLGGYHPLSYAAYTGNTELMELLLKAGADPNVVESNGKTALYITANMANVEGLVLLHKHKTKLPPKSAQPPARAAVHSSSLEGLKKLLELYPHADLQRGWKRQGTQMDRLFQDSPGDPVSYASYHGYEEMALYLLSKNAQVSGRDILGKNALHHAAIHPRCSPALVKALLEAGCPPLLKAHRPHQRYDSRQNPPYTPLDYAVISGDFEKVKLLALAANSEASRPTVRYSAHLAAAYNREKISQYLLSLIGESMPNYIELLGMKRASDVPSSGSPSMLDKDLARIMPRARSRKGGLPEAGTLAILSEAGLQNQASLLFAELSKQDGIMLVERDELDAVASELSLRGLKESDSKAVHESLELIPARHVIVLSKNSYGGKSFVRIETLDSVSGLIVDSQSLPPNALTQKANIPDLVKGLLFSIGGDRERAMAVSLTSISTETVDQKALVLADDLNALLPHYAANTNGMVSLSRDQLGHLQREKVIGLDGSFWAAGWVLDGGMGAVDKDAATLTLRAIHATSKKEVKISGQVALSQVDQGLRACWKDLMLALKDDGSPASAMQLANEDALDKEAEVLFQHAKWLHAAKYFDESAEVMRSCLALGKPNEEREHFALLTQSKVVMFLLKNLDAPSLSVSMGEYGEYGRQYYDGPRVVSHEYRLKLLAAADQIIRLGNLAEDRLNGVAKPKSAYGSWSVSNEFNHELNGCLHSLVSQALSEMLYTVAVLDHSMVLRLPEGRSAYESLSAQIGRITQKYIAEIENAQKAKGYSATQLRQITSRHLLNRDYQFYARYHPELLRKLTALRYGQLDEHQAYYDNLFTDAMNHAVWSRQVGLTEASELWRELAMSVLEAGRQTGHHVFSSGPLYWMNSREERLEWLHYLSLQDRDTESTYTNRMGNGVFQNGTVIETHPIKDLVGVEVFDHKGVSSEVMEQALIPDWKEVRGTTESIRLSGCYRMIDEMVNKDDKGLKSHLKNRLQNIDPQYSPEWSKDVWREVRLVILDSADRNREVRGYLSQIADVEYDDGLEDGELKLTQNEMILMPEQKTQGDRVFRAIPSRASIHGDELWLPGVYEKPRDPNIDYGKDAENAIQVISLEDRSIKTILIPRTGDRPDEGERMMSMIFKRFVGRLLLTKDYAYISPNGIRLYCIRRDNHAVKEITFPGEHRPGISLMDVHVERGLLLLKTEFYPKGRTLHKIMMIEGEEVKATLVSNYRKPSQSPLDRPNFACDSMAFKGDMLWIGNQHMKFIYTYDLKTSKWKKHSRNMLAEMKDLADIRQKYDHVESYPEDLKAYFLGVPGGFNAGMWHTGVYPYRSINLDYPPFDTYARFKMGEIKVEIEEVDHASFARPNFPKVLDDGEESDEAALLWPGVESSRFRKGWWISPNEAIKQGLFSAVVIGDWGDKVLVGLSCFNPGKGQARHHHYHYEHGLGAVWMIPRAKFEAALEPLKDRQSRMVDFTYSWKSEQFKETAGISFSDFKKDFRWTSRYSLLMHGGGAVLGIQPAIELKDTELMISISRKTKSKKLDFIIEVGDKDDPTEIFNSKDHDLGTADKFHKANLYMALPDGTKEIRVINHGPKDHSMYIRGFIFLPKE